MEDVDEKSALGADPNTWELEGVALHSFFFVFFNCNCCAIFNDVIGES